LIDDWEKDILGPVQTTKPQQAPKPNSNIDLLSEIFGEPLVPATSTSAPNITSSTPAWDLTSIMPEPTPLVNVAVPGNQDIGFC
jgi:hypothetical protein